MMKKYFYLLFLLASFSGNAQNVPNGGFENWINYTGYSTPVSWATTDSTSVAQTSGTRSVLQDTITVHSGHSAMKMQSWVYSLFATEPGAASNGNIDVASLSIVGGTPDTTRHDMLTGWYEYNSVGGDSCTVSVLLLRWNGASRDTVATGMWSTTTNASSYTQFTLNMDYRLSGNPDTVLIVIVSAPLGINSAHAGTVLYIDDLNFTGVNSTNDLPANLFSLIAFPNPASNFLNIELKGNSAPAKGSVSILDLSGKLLQSIPVLDRKQCIDISALANGNYFYELVDEKGTKLYTGKFSVLH